MIRWPPGGAVGAQSRRFTAATTAIVAGTSEREDGGLKRSRSDTVTNEASGVGGRRCWDESVGEEVVEDGRWAMCASAQSNAAIGTTGTRSLT